MRVFREITFNRHAALEAEDIATQTEVLKQEARRWLKHCPGAIPQNNGELVVEAEVQASEQSYWMDLTLTLTYETAPGQAVEGIRWQLFAPHYNYELLGPGVRRSLLSQVEQWKKDHLMATAKNPCQMVSEMLDEEACRQAANMVHSFTYTIFYLELTECP